MSDLDYEDDYFDQRFAFLKKMFASFDPPEEDDPNIMEARRDLQAMMDFAVVNFGVKTMMFIMADSVKLAAENFKDSNRENPNLIRIMQDADRWVALFLMLGQGHTHVSLDSEEIIRFSLEQSERVSQALSFRQKVLAGIPKTKSEKRKSKNEN